jgi:hypothetical protein
MLYPTELRARVNFHVAAAAETDLSVVGHCFGPSIVIVPVMATLVPYFDLSLHQYASPAIRQHAVSYRRPQFGTGVAQLRFQLGCIGGFDQFELITLMGHPRIVNRQPLAALRGKGPPRFARQGRAALSARAGMAGSLSLAGMGSRSLRSRGTSILALLLTTH